METFIIHMILTLIGMAVKNPSKADALKTHLLEVRDGINDLYPGE